MNLYRFRTRIPTGGLLSTMPPGVPGLGGKLNPHSSQVRASSLFCVRHIGHRPMAILGLHLPQHLQG